MIDVTVSLLNAMPNKFMRESTPLSFPIVTCHILYGTNFYSACYLVWEMNSCVIQIKVPKSL